MSRIHPYRKEEETAVIALWERCGLTTPWNNPQADIARKMTVQPEMFLIAEDGQGNVIGTVMAGFDGHRGWINYLAVATEHRRRGVGKALMDAAADRLRSIGCPKINLQIRRSNMEAVEFYKALGYQEDEVVSFGFRLIADE